jgi:hypothetical protein
VEDSGAVDSLVRWSGALLDNIVAVLGKVGIELPPIALQLFLLALVIGLLIPALKRLGARGKTDRLPLVASVALALVALGVSIGLIENATTPDRVAGSLSSDRLADVRVELLDFRDRSISSGSGLVDTSTGRFALHYDPLIDGRARKLRITAPGCRVQDIELSRTQLRTGSELRWSHQCVAG